MKIYQINVVCGSGSTGRITVDLSKAIKYAGGQCRIAYGRGTAPSDINAFKISGKIDLYGHVIMTRITDRQGLYSKKATKRLIKDIRKYNPDIIHLHNIHGYYLNYEMLFEFLDQYNKSVVWTLHDCWAFTGHCAHFDYVGCDKWKEGCEDCPQIRNYPASYCVDNSRKNYMLKKKMFTNSRKMTIVTVSKWLNSVTKQSFLQMFPIETIYNGIDLDVFRPVESEIRKKYNLENIKIILGVASIWDKRKGLYTFVELSKHLTKDMKIVLIGLTAKQCKSIPENILCFEKTHNIQELVEWYSTADIYVNASVEETMGLTTVEAMACGTPVVVMNATAVPEVITESSGVIVEPGDMDALVTATKALEKDVTVSKCCITRAAEFAKSKKYEEYIKIYNKLLG